MEYVCPPYMRDYRIPLFLYQKTSPKSISERKGDMIVQQYNQETKQWEIYKKVNSDLLVSIDENNVEKVKENMEKNNIPVNGRFLLPIWELDNFVDNDIQLSTFLHRSVEKNSPDVFRFLLEHGANTQEKNQYGQSVIEAVFDGKYVQQPERQFRFGEILIEYGLTVEELKVANWDGVTSVYRKLRRKLNEINKKRVISSVKPIFRKRIDRQRS